MCAGVQGNGGFWPIQCNPVNAGVGWPYPAKAAIYSRNALSLPGRTAAAHLYGLIGFGENFSQCLSYQGTDTPAIQEQYCVEVVIYIVTVTVFLNIRVVDIRTLGSLCFGQLWEAKFGVHITLDVDK